jgi:hypothetical protein
MRIYSPIFALAVIVLASSIAFSQQVGLSQYLELLKIAPGQNLEAKIDTLNKMGIKLSPQGLRELSTKANSTYSTPTINPNPYLAPPVAIHPVIPPTGEYLGQLSTNPYPSNSIANPYGAGNPYKPESITNPFSPNGSRFGANSPSNPYATDTPKLYDANGNYRGKLSSNPYDPDSVSNPYGRYGSKYSTDSLNNPYGAGSPYKTDSPNNPYGQGWSIYSPSNKK